MSDFLLHTLSIFFGVYLREHAANELLLRCGVGFTIVSELLLQGVLERCIPGAKFFIHAEQLTKLQVVAPLRVSGCDDMQVMSTPLRR